MNGASAHNALYRGKNLTDIYSIEDLHEKLNSGDFSDLYVGDYITLTVPSLDTTEEEELDLILADFDYWYNSSNVVTPPHHVVLIPKTCLKDPCQWNETNDTVTGGINGKAGYSDSLIRSKLLVWGDVLNDSQYLNGHLLKFVDLISNEVNKDVPSMAGSGLKGSTCFNENTFQMRQYAELLNEPEVYGTTVFSSSGLDVGVGSRQLSLFRLNHSARIATLGKESEENCHWWLSAVVSTAYAARVNYNGNPGDTTTGTGIDSENLHGVRPMLIFS